MAVENIFRILKSIVAGRRPPVNPDHAGIPFINFADKQFGALDTAGNPVDLLAVRHYSATAKYVADDLVVRSGVIYKAKTVISPGGWNAAHWTHVITLKLGETATTAYRGDHGKANRDDIDTMAVTKHDPAKVYAKNDLVSYANEIWFAKAAVPVGAWDETKWQPIGIQTIAKDVTATIGVGGDYPTINKAMSHFANYYPLYGDDGITVTLTLLPGFVIAEQILIDGVNFSWITITSGQAGPHNVTGSAITKNLGGSIEKPVIGVIHGGQSPYLDFVGRFVGGGSGMGLYADSAGRIIGNKLGFLNSPKEGCSARNTGVITALSSLNVGDAGSYGIVAATGGIVTSKATILCQNAGTSGVFATTNAAISARNLDSHDCKGIGINLTTGASMTIQEKITNTDATQHGISIGANARLVADTIDTRGAGKLGVICMGSGVLSAITNLSAEGALGANCVYAATGGHINSMGSLHARKKVGIDSIADIIVLFGGFISRKSGRGGMPVAQQGGKITPNGYINR